MGVGTGANIAAISFWPSRTDLGSHVFAEPPATSTYAASPVGPTMPRTLRALGRALSLAASEARPLPLLTTVLTTGALSDSGTKVAADSDSAGSASALKSPASGGDFKLSRYYARDGPGINPAY